MMEILQSLIKHLYQPTVFARDPFKAAASHTTLNSFRFRAGISKSRLRNYCFKSTKMEIQLNREVLLGQGGFGAVFLGTFQDRKVAVKRVELIRVNDEEEKNLKQIDHPNIVKLLHVECTDDFK
jgi:hypothetical protein